MKFPCWFSMFLLLVDHPFKLPKATKAIHGWFLALLACKTEADLLWCLLATTKEWLNTTHKTFLLAIIPTTTEGNFAFFTTAGLGNLYCSVLFAVFAEEFLCFWIVHHVERIDQTTVTFIQRRLIKPINFYEVYWILLRRQNEKQ